MSCNPELDWRPSAAAMRVDVVVDPQDASPGGVLVDHFNDPFDVVLADGVDESLQAAAHAYLGRLLDDERIGPRLGLPPHWLPALDPRRDASQEPYFGWLPFEPVPEGGKTFIGPYGSFRFQSPSDKLAVLYASERLDADFYLGSGFGLAIVTHVREDGGTLRACFTGLTATLPYGRYREHPLGQASPQERLDAGLEPWLSVDHLYRDSAATGAMAAAARLERFVVRGLRIARAGRRLWIERQGTGVRRSGADAMAPAGCEVPYLVSMLSTGEDAPTVHTVLHVAPVVADAGEARVFESEPSSLHGHPVRPTRDERASLPLQALGLDDFRRPTGIFPTGATAGALEHAVGTPAAVARVMPCPRFVGADRPLDPAKARTVTLQPGGPAVRCDDASAVQAFVHARDLLDRLVAYGWSSPSAYFRITAPEIRIFYRSGISPGPGKDGRTVNARVIPQGWPPGVIGRDQNDATRPAVQIHLASADQRRRERKARTPGDPPSAATPFGIAADRRWMWHEFGHVLLVASTGELEFRFAHSPGDAMAAIVADPASKLTQASRGLTFPFVFLPRQHSRCALDGWSWSGTLHAALGAVPGALQPRRKGYWSEQILSSSLFRLYRTVGGDTGVLGDPNDAAERRRASHYCLYLIMQAMQLMGDVRVQVVSTPGQFVHLLRQADRQTGTWTAAFGSETFARVGGTLSKVIRWAFEAQGLYGNGDGPGPAEPVDIYIRDERPTTDNPVYGRADYGAGSYVPVPLDWPASGAAPWHASAAAGIVFPDANGLVEVRVGNRGTLAARKVKVRLWSVRWDGNTNPPDWSSSAGVWTEHPASGPKVQDIPSGSPGVGFTFSFAPPAGRYILFAEATCADDRAHTDPALSLACASTDTPLADLVANDNNLGVRVVEV